MANITLKAGESFEHAHTERSRTTLIAGDAEVIVFGKRIRLAIGEDQFFPAGASHKIINTGTTNCTVDCCNEIGTEGPPGR